MRWFARFYIYVDPRGGSQCGSWCGAVCCVTCLPLRGVHACAVLCAMHTVLSVSVCCQELRLQHYYNICYCYCADILILRTYVRVRIVYSV